jgi:hypothetical protein
MVKWERSIVLFILKPLAFFGIHLYFSEWLFVFFAVVAFVQQNNFETDNARQNHFALSRFTGFRTAGQDY